MTITKIVHPRSAREPGAVATSMDGFDVIAELPAEALRAVVFVTAHDEYAIRAFDVEAIDCLLEELGREPAMVERLRCLLGSGDERGPALRRIAVRSGGRMQSLRVEEIQWFAAADNYSRIHTAKAVHLIRETLSALERRLDPSVFIRIHRSAIVQIESIREVESLFHGDYEVVLRTGERLPVGRKYRDRLVEAMGGRS